jgi:RNA polymerase sigma-70 factor (ECF subfamily)
MGDGRSEPPATDAVLVAAVAAGSEDALAALYDRHASHIHSTALRLGGDRGVAEDVVQEVFLTLWNRAEQFDPAIGSLAAWLGSITRHRAIDRLRAASRRPRLVSLGAGLDDEPAADALDRAAAGRSVGASLGAPDPAASLDASEARAAIAAALTAMPDPERDVILLAYRDELSQSEIAARLGWPLGTVKTRTRRALARMRLALVDVYGPSLAPVAVEPADDSPLALRGSGGDA